MHLYERAEGWGGPATVGGTHALGLVLMATWLTACNFSNHAWRPMVPVEPMAVARADSRQAGADQERDTVRTRDGQYYPLAIDPATFGGGVWGVDGSLVSRPLACGYDRENRMFSHGAAQLSSEPNACTHDAHGAPRIADDNLPPAERYSFATIEFDDFGEFWNPHQLTWASERLKFIGRGASGELGDNPRIILLGYVHGWRHNASEHSKDFREFRDMVRTLAGRSDACDLFDHGAEMESSALYDEVLNRITPVRRVAVTQPMRLPCHVFGFYIGWRGDSTGLTQLPPMPDNRRSQRKGNPLLKALRGTAWLAQSLSPLGRKASARRVASVPATRALLELGAAFAELESVRRQSFFRSRLGDRRLDSMCPQAAEGKTLKHVLDAWARNCASRSIVVGHSFGARVLENAVAQGLIGRQDLARRMNVDDRAELVGRLLEARQVRSQLSRQASEDVDGLLTLLTDAKAVMDAQLKDANEKVDAAAAAVSELDGERARSIRDRSALRGTLKIAVEQSIARDRFHEIHRVACRHLQRRERLPFEMRQPELGAIAYDCSPLSVTETDAEFLDRPEVGAALVQYHRTFQQCAEGRLVNDATYDACVAEVGRLDTAFAGAVAPCDVPGRTADLDKICGLLQTVSQNIGTLVAAGRGLVANRRNAVGAAAEQAEARGELQALRSSSQDISERLAEYQKRVDDARAKLASDTEDAEQTRSMVVDLILAMHSDVISLTRPPFDTVVLVNPATEALSAAMLREGLDDWRELRVRLLGKGASQSPMLVSMTSRGDLATRCGLPLTRVAERFASPARRDDMFGLAQPPERSERSRAESNWSLCGDALDENWFGKAEPLEADRETEKQRQRAEKNRGKGRKQYVYLGKPAAAIRDLQSHRFVLAEQRSAGGEQTFCFQSHCARSDKKAAKSARARIGCSINAEPSEGSHRICYAKSVKPMLQSEAEPGEWEQRSLYETYFLPKDIVRSHGDVLDNPLLQAMIIHQAAQWAAQPFCPKSDAGFDEADPSSEPEGRYCHLVDEIKLEQLSPAPATRQALSAVD